MLEGEEILYISWTFHQTLLLLRPAHRHTDPQIHSRSRCGEAVRVPAVGPVLGPSPGEAPPGQAGPGGPRLSAPASPRGDLATIVHVPPLRVYPVSTSPSRAAGAGRTWSRCPNAPHWAHRGILHLLSSTLPGRHRVPFTAPHCPFTAPP